MRKYLLATVSATIIALCSSGYADNTACTVAQMNTITDVNACQNFANNCGMDTFMANADISFGNFSLILPIQMKAAVAAIKPPNNAQPHLTLAVLIWHLAEMQQCGQMLKNYF